MNETDAALQSKRGEEDEGVLSLDTYLVMDGVEEGGLIVKSYSPVNRIDSVSAT